MWLPNRIIQSATLLCVAATAAVLWIVLSQPWLGLVLTADPHAKIIRVNATHASGPASAVPVPTVLHTIGPSSNAQSIALEPDDLVEEPDLFETYEQLRHFFNRQGALATVLQESQVALHLGTADSNHSITIAPARRPVSDLPAPFWVQLITGASSLLIGAWVWAMRPADVATRLFALSGAMITLSAYAAAIYSSRELAIDGTTFRILSVLNHIGALGFGMGMIAMFLCYPRRLVPLWTLWTVPAVFGAWLVADILQLPPNQSIGMQLPTSIEMLLIVVIVGVQWFVNRRDPRARAALSWLGLSVILGAGTFVSLIIMPILFDAAPAMQQGYAFGFFFLIYAGLALGVGRYRLFDLSEWAFRVLFYSGGTLLLIAIDAALITILHLQQTLSFGIALLAVGFIYLPLRARLWNRFVVRKTLEDHELFRAVIDVSFAASAAERSGRWRDLLHQLFDPLALEATDEHVADVDVRNEGLEVRLPPVVDTPALVLRYPWRGRRLFSTTHKTLTHELVRLMRYAEESRSAYERGSAEERRRIARDLHDDVGARLLSGLFKRDIDDTRRVLREAIADIRTIVSGLSTDQPPLGQIIAALRHETGERLTGAGIEMRWPIGENDDSSLTLEYPIFRCFVSAHREIVSNIIRHASARNVEITVSRTTDWLITRITDDGIGIDPVHMAGSPNGNGLHGLMRRCAELNGKLTFYRPDKGTVAEIHIPLQRNVSPEIPRISAPETAS